MLIGYARVSTTEQNLDLQQDALAAAGCDKVFLDKISTRSDARPGLAEAKAFMRDGDTFVVWRLDRLGRSVSHLIREVQELDKKGVGFKSLQESFDTTTPGGKLIFHMFAALAEFERDLVRERTEAGLASARARGRMGGRPRALTPQKIAQARALRSDPSLSIKEICETLQISPATFYRYTDTDERK